MKSSKLLLLVLFSLVFQGNRILANCTAHFTWSQTAPNVIGFTNTSVFTGSYPIYYWTFGDGQNSYGPYGSHTFNIPGRYAVCLNVTDSANTSGGCNNTFCDTITVTGSVICNISLQLQSSNAACLTCPNGTASVNYITGANGAITYSWSGNGASGIGTASSISGLLPATYTLIVTDAYGCHGAASVTVLSNDSNCHAHFTKVQSAQNTIQFTDNSLHTSSNTNYYWDFGNGSSGYGLNPAQMYNVPGTYTVCLTISDSANIAGACQSTYCDTVKVTGGVICNLGDSVYTVQPSCSTCSDGSASASVIGGTAPYTYSWSKAGISGTIATGLTPGNYTVCVFDANGCHSCNSFTLSVSHCHAYFTLRPDSSSAGDYIATDYSTGSGTIHSTWNWGDHTFDSSATPTHTYNSPGLYQICLTISDSLGCSSTYCDTLTAARLAYWTATHHTKINVVKAKKLTGMQELHLVEGWKIYPNPTNGSSTVQYFLKQDASVGMVLYDLTGQQMMVTEKAMPQSAGEHQVMIDIGSVSPGMYFLRIKANDQFETKRIILAR